MELITRDELHSKIFTIRGVQVMIDRDLAELYGVQTKVLNQAVKRNKERFPISFTFLLNAQESFELVTNCDRLKNLKHSTNNPIAFTEQGVAMLSSVLRSKVAVNVSIQIINAFVDMRKILIDYSGLLQRMEGMERKLIESDQKFERIFSELEQNNLPKQGIFFEGQLFDAYVFINKIIKKASKSIILIDNYVDEKTLVMLSKRNQQCEAIIYTQKINAQLKLDFAKHNEQYPFIEVKELKNVHDRFLIIDRKELYHIGASLKDLGNKWFAFSKLDEFLPEVLERLRNV